MKFIPSFFAVTISVASFAHATQASTQVKEALLAKMPQISQAQTPPSSDNGDDVPHRGGSRR